MTDLLDRLATLDESLPAPTPEVVSADLRRGIAARARRQRRSQLGLGAGLAVTLIGGLGITGIGASHLPAEGPGQATDAATQRASGTQLVAYTGQQPEAFEVAVIPEGYVVQGSDAYVFTVAPRGNNTHYLDFEDKIVVTLEDGMKAQNQIEGTPIDVGDVEGGISDQDSDQDASTTLEFMQGPYDVTVQMWESVDLTDEQLAAFADGITVTDDAQTPGPPPDSDSGTDDLPPPPPGTRYAEGYRGITN